MIRRALVFQHMDDEPPGLFGDFLREQGAALDIVMLHRGETIPPLAPYDFLLVMGGAIAVHLAAEVKDEDGLIVEGTFPSIPDVVSTFKWGWLPIAPLITQKLDAGSRIARVGSPVLVVHGGNDSLIQPTLGRQLFERAAEPKRFVLVEGGSHHNTNAVGQPLYRQALAELFGLNP